MFNGLQVHLFTTFNQSWFFKVLALVVGQFWHVYWISYCKKCIFTPFFYKFIQVTACKKLTYYTSAWLSYCRTNKGAVFYAALHSVDMLLCINSHSKLSFVSHYEMLSYSFLSSFAVLASGWPWMTLNRHLASSRIYKNVHLLDSLLLIFCVM